jgi:DNA-binding CsgD family transcriptional regulator
MTDKLRESPVKPLTGNDKKGRPYIRPAAVEEEIKAVLEWPLSKAFGLAAEGRLRPQTLVYLMRSCKPNQPTPEYDALVVAFFSRLERSGDRLISGMSDLDRERVNGMVMDKALTLIADDHLDIFEMSFKTGAERLYLTEISKVRLRTRTEVSREDLVDPDSDLTGEETADALGFVADGAMPLAEARAMLREVCEGLTDKEFRAIYYVHHGGLTEKEAAKLMNCSDRNVRYLITSARQKARGHTKSAGENARGKE